MSDTRTEPSDDIEQVYRRERPALLRLAFLLTGSRDLAEDVVQTAFVQSRTRWSSIDQPSAYLRRVVINQVKGIQRRAYRAVASTREVVTEIPEIDETWRQVVRLPAPQRAVVILRFYEDLPLVQIAEILDRPEPTVRSDLHRALRRLRSTLP